MSALSVAATARRHLVLDPGGPALHLGHQVIGGRLDKAGERPAAPHAAVAVADHDGPQPLDSILVGGTRVGPRRDVGHRVTRRRARAARRSRYERSTARTDPANS